MFGVKYSQALASHLFRKAGLPGIGYPDLDGTQTLCPECLTMLTHTSSVGELGLSTALQLIPTPRRRHVHIVPRNSNEQ